MDLTTLFTIIGVVLAALVMVYQAVNQWTSMQTKMDMIIVVLGEIKANLIAQAHDVKDLENRVIRLEEHFLKKKEEEGA